MFEKRRLKQLSFDFTWEICHLLDITAVAGHLSWLAVLLVLSCSGSFVLFYVCSDLQEGFAGPWLWRCLEVFPCSVTKEVSHRGGDKGTHTDSSRSESELEEVEEIWEGVPVHQRTGVPAGGSHWKSWGKKYEEYQSITIGESHWKSGGKKYEKEYQSIREQESQQEDPIERVEVRNMRRSTSLSENRSYSRRIPLKELR